MKRVKQVSIVAMATLALALSVSVASASATSGFMTGTFPATLKGVPATYLNLKTNMGTAGNCYSTFYGSVPRPADSASVALFEEISCSSVKVKSNGCKLNLKPGAETSPGVFAGSAEISGCSTGISFYQSPCTFTFPPQGIDATFENIGSGSSAEIKVTLGDSSVEYVNSGYSGCLPGTYKNGVVEGSWKTYAEDAIGNQVNAHVGKPNTLHMGGSSETPSNPPRFKAEKGYPAGVIGKQGTQHQLYMPAIGTFKCSAVNLGGVLSGPSAEALLDPEFVTCGIGGMKVKVRTNSCDYRFDVANVGPAYAGTLNLVCSGSDQLEVDINSSTCTVKFPAQQLATVGYETSGIGVLAKLTGEGVKYTLGEGCSGYGTPGSYTNGTFSGSTTLEAIL
jgi:hypothetical protein